MGRVVIGGIIAITMAGLVRAAVPADDPVRVLEPVTPGLVDPKLDLYLFLGRIVAVPPEFKSNMDLDYNLDVILEWRQRLRVGERIRVIGRIYDTALHPEYDLPVWSKGSTVLVLAKGLAAPGQLHYVSREIIPIGLRTGSTVPGANVAAVREGLVQMEKFLLRTAAGEAAKQMVVTYRASENYCLWAMGTAFWARTVVAERIRAEAEALAEKGDDAARMLWMDYLLDHAVLPDNRPPALWRVGWLRMWLRKSVAKELLSCRE